MASYGSRPGQSYQDEAGRYIYERDEHSAYRTGRDGRGLWLVTYGPSVPGGFRERQVYGDSQYLATSPGHHKMHCEKQA